MLNSRQIRPPIYSLKQSKLRKRRVVRYAILYFLMFFLFLILIVGPAIAGRFIGDITSGLSIPLNLLQPVGWNNNDTSGKSTGTATQAGGAGGPASGTAGGGSGGSSSPSNPFASSTAGAKRTAVFLKDYYI